jgi:RHS repeat-associated protein
MSHKIWRTSGCRSLPPLAVLASLVLAPAPCTTQILGSLLPVDAALDGRAPGVCLLGVVALLALAWAAFGSVARRRASARAIAVLWCGALAGLCLVSPSTAAAASAPVTALAPVEIWADGFGDLRGITVDAGGNVFVADRHAGRVIRIAPDRSRTVVADRLQWPIGLAFDLPARLLIAEEGAGRVVRLEPGGTRTPLLRGVTQPRWLAVHESGTLFVSARGLTRQTAPAPEDLSVAPDVILALSPTGGVRVVAGRFRGLQGLAVTRDVLYAATTGRRADGDDDGVIFRIPLLPDGSAGGPVPHGSGSEFEEPGGLARDRLGALYLSTGELELGEDDERERAVAKVHPDGHVTVFAEGLRRPQGLAFDAAGNLYLADGTGGRVLRFHAPPAPTLTVPAFTGGASVTITGTTEPGARVDLFVNDAATPVTAIADSRGAFSVSFTLSGDRPTRLEVFATAHGGDGLTSAPATATISPDGAAPTLVFRAPAAGAHVRQAVPVEVQASDSGSQVASLALTVDGQPLPAALAPAPPAETVTATATWQTTTLADGAHTLGATASDRAGNVASASRVVIVDNTAPEARITEGPSGEVGGTTVTFTFAGMDNLTGPAELQFAWRLDGGAFTAFSPATTATLTELTEGAHTFEVTARDLAGNEDPTPASRTFTVRLGPAITSLAPASGPIGTLVTITGTGFAPGPTQVAFSGVAAVVRTLTAVEITTTVPAGATTGPVTVTTPRGTASAAFTVTTTGDFTLTAAPAPPATARVIAGDQTSVSLAAGGTGSFTSLVRLSVSPPSAGITTSLSPELVAPGRTSFLTFAVASSVATGRYAFTVTGQAQVDGQTLTRTASVTVEVLPPDTTAVTGRVLTADAVPQPLPGVTVTLGAAFTLTDAGGNFVLLAPPAGANMLLVDGRTASTATAQYPPVEVNIAVTTSGPTRVPFIVYLPRLDTAHPVTLPTDTSGTVTQTVQATTPLIPGLVVTVSAGTKITGPDGNPVNQITITPVPIDRSPMPFPPGVTAPMLFTIQPGGAVPSTPLPITFPNTQQAPAGTKADLYFFDLIAGTWQTWGTGTVSSDGTQIVSDPGFGLPRFAWHFAASQVSLSDQVRSRGAKGGEPVDLVTGRFSVSQTDLVLPGRIPVSIQRTYRSENPRAGLLGIGWDLDLYDTRLTTAGTSMSLILPDQSSYLLAPAGSGRWTNSTEPFLRGAVLTQLPGEFNFQLRLKDGTLHRFNLIFGFVNLAGLSSITDSNGNTVTVTRESPGPTQNLFGLITRLAEPAGRTLTLAYDGAGRIISITDPIGRVVRYTYDAQGRLATVTDPAGGVTAYTYDSAHRIRSVTDPRGITFLRNEYDAAGRVIRQTQADGGVWTFAYTLAGGVITETIVTDPRGSPTTHRFSSEGFTLAQTDALGQTTTFEYAPGSNLLLATTDPLGRVTRFEYDAQGNVTRITDPAGHSRTFTYEPTFNKLASITDPLGNVTRFEYDPQGNFTATVDPLGARTALTYNSFGQPLTTTDPLGNTTTFSYDDQGDLATIADPLGGTTRRQYDAVSRLTRQFDPRGKPTGFAYDPLNRLTSLSDALGRVTRFAYDGNGNLLTVTDARGSVTTHTYDNMDRLATRTDPVGATESFASDPVGNLVRHTDRKGQVSTFTYDGLNRRTGASYVDGSTTSFAYDAAGRLIQAGDSVGGTIQNQYDALDRLLAQATGFGTVSYQYDALGRRTRMDSPGQTPVTYGYDAASRLTTITQSSQIVDLTYDIAGRRKRLTLPNGVSTEYQYDGASRLLALIYRNAVGQLGDLAYQYDTAGNRVSIGGSFARTLMPDPVASANYDAAHRQLIFGELALTYDLNGNLTSDGTNTYTWDPLNRLIAVATPSVSASFVYDAQDRRLLKTVNGVVVRYLYDGLDVVTELAEFLAVPYLRTLDVDEALGRGTGEFYLTDALGSTVALTNAHGTLATAYTYAPFGATVTDNPADANPFQFTGRENDATGLYYYRTRYYHPALARFIAEDPVSFSGGVHSYAYVGNSPVMFVDPFGLDKNKRDCDAATQARMLANPPMQVQYPASGGMRVFEDKYGWGFFRAPRPLNEDPFHHGVDILGQPGEIVKLPFRGKITRYRPDLKDPKLRFNRGLTITDPSANPVYQVSLFHIDPKTRGILDPAELPKYRKPPMAAHVHFQLEFRDATGRWCYADPTPYLFR